MTMNSNVTQSPITEVEVSIAQALDKVKANSFYLKKIISDLGLLHLERSLPQLAFNCWLNHCAAAPLETP